MLLGLDAVSNQHREEEPMKWSLDKEHERLVMEAESGLDAFVLGRTSVIHPVDMTVTLNKIAVEIDFVVAQNALQKKTD